MADDKTIKISDGVSEQKNSGGNTNHLVSYDTIRTAIAGANLPSNAVITKAELLVDAHYTGGLSVARIYLYAGLTQDGSNIISANWIDGERIPVKEASRFTSVDVKGGLFTDYDYPFPLKTSYYENPYKGVLVQLRTDNVTARKHFIDDVYLKLYYETYNYTITWANVDGNGNSKTTTVGRNSMPTAPATEEKDTAEWDYTFLGWTPAIEVAKGDKTYTAQFSEVRFTYTQTVSAGTGGTVKVFVGGSETSERTFEYGTQITIKAVPDTGYRFVEWEEDGNGNDERNITIQGTGTYTATFELRSYSVKFLGENGEPLDEQYIIHGDTVTPPTAPEKADTEDRDYSFAGWQDENGNWWSSSTPITGKTTYTARYDWEKRKYTVRWYNWDGELLSTTENVEHGTAPTYYGETPTRPDDDYYKYTFAGWSPDPSIGIKGDTEYTAQFGWTDRYYVVRWVNGSVDSERINAFLASGEITQADYDQLVKFVTNPELLELEKDEDVKFNAQPDYDEVLHGIPVHPLQGIDPEYNYSFIGWSTEVTNPAKPDTELETVKGDITYTAMYATSKIKYAITVYVYNQNAEYAEYPYERDYGETFRVEAPDDIVGYKFVRWSDGDTNTVKRFTVKGVVTLRAEYERSQIPVKVNTEQVTGVYIVPDANNPDTGEIVYVISGTVPEVTVRAVSVDGWHFTVSNTIPANSYPLEKLFINGTRVW